MADLESKEGWSRFKFEKGRFVGEGESLMDKQSDQTKVYDFIRTNPGATTKAIRKGARVRHERVTAISAEGVASGDLVMTAGFWGSKCYELAKTPEPKILVPVLVPVAQVLPPDLGLALLHPGPAFSGSRPIPTESQDDGKHTNLPANAPIPEPKAVPIDAPPVPHRETEWEWSGRMRREALAQETQVKTAGPQLNPPVPPEPQNVVTREMMQDWETRTRDRRPINPSRNIVR